MAQRLNSNLFAKVQSLAIRRNTKKLVFLHRGIKNERDQNLTAVVTFYFIYSNNI